MNYDYSEFVRNLGLVADGDRLGLRTPREALRIALAILNSEPQLLCNLLCFDQIFHTISIYRGFKSK